MARMYSRPYQVAVTFKGRLGNEKSEPFMAVEIARRPCLHLIAGLAI